MTRNRKISMASLFVILGGGLFLTSPADAATGAALTCRESVRAYCQYVADSYCTRGATCTYNTQTCEVTNAQCWAD